MKNVKSITTKFSVIICVLTTIFTYNTDNLSTVHAADTTTRAEWMHELVEIFNMTIEDGLIPDDYYGDIAGTAYYDDILIAVNFGVVDLEAGEDFLPNAVVTREFAAHTLNYCLGYELDEDAKYVMNDYSDLQFAADAQIAIDLGWFSLIDNAFEPDRAVTLSEKNNMLAYARNVLLNAEIDENHDNVYEFAEGVIVIPENIEVELDSEDTVKIYNTSANLKKGDSFAVFLHGIAYTYKAVSVFKESDYITVEVEELSYDDAVELVDAEGVIEADLGEFVPASDDVTVDVEYEDSGISTYAIGKTDKSVKDINISKSVQGGKIGCKISSIKVSYRLVNSNEYIFSISGKATVSYSMSAKQSLTLDMGYFNIAGVGRIDVKVTYSASGTAIVSLSSNFETGIEKVKGQGVRKIKNFTTPTWKFSAKAELKTACTITATIGIPDMGGSVYGEFGVKATPDIEVYTDGKSPKTCMDIPAYVYAEVGYFVKVFGKQVLGETIPIYTASNSPVKLCYHVEDGKLVDVCARPGSSSRVGKRGYYTSPNAVGTYSGECFIAPYEGTKIFEYKADDAGNATITKYSGNVYALTIPDEIDGYTVTAIGSNAFMGNTSLGIVVIPNTVTSIYVNAFKECTTLKEVVMPPNLINIGCGAFQNCILLANINIPKSLNTGYMGANYMYPGAFQGCISLKSVDFENGITKIPSGLFYNCTGLKSVVIPESVTSIEENAFLNCNGLIDIILPKSLTFINRTAFKSCTNLTEIELPRDLIGLESGAFQDCISIEKVNIPVKISTGYMGVNYMYPGAFSGCSNLKTVIFDTGITRIPNGILYGCTGLEEIYIPNTVTEISENVFLNCTNLREIDIPNSVTNMGTSVFSGCTSLEKAHIPENSVNIPNSTFSGCTSLTEINLPDTLQTIGSSAFYNCTSLTEIKLPEQVNTINTNAFYGCTALTKVTMPVSMRKINASAFSHCEALTDLTIAEGTTEIGSNAFEYCKALKTVTLPDSLQTLGSYAFRYCNVLSEVNIGAGLRVIPSYCFYEDPALQKVILPQQVTTVNQYAFGNCTKFTDIIMNRNVTSVALNAFSYPGNLTIHGISGTYPQTFATENNITFVPLDVPVTAIKLNKPECQVASGYTLQLTANITPADSSDELTWTSTDEEIVTVDANGLIKGIKTGTATILAMAGDVIENCEVTVYEKVTSVSLNTTSKEMSIGDTLQLKATVYPTNATNKNISWSTSDETVATVDANGLVTAKAYGTATITVTTEDSGYTRTCTVTVKPIAVTGITLNAKTAVVGVGSTYQLVPTISPKNASIKEVTWTSSKPAVATVENGLVTGISEGTAVIIVKTQDGAKTASCTITVKNMSVTGVTLDKTELEMETRTTYQLTETIEPLEAGNKAVTWSSDNEDVATVKNGKITAKKAGIAHITVTTNDGGFTASCTVTVIGHSVTGVTLSKESISMETGNCALLEAVVTPENADDKSVTWDSSDAQVVTVDNETGVLTAVSAGTAIITVTTTDGNYEATCEVTVTEVENPDDIIHVSGVTVIPTDESIAEENTVEVGKEFTLDAVIVPENATNQNVIWLSNNKEIAVITQEGVVTTKGVGEVTFTVISEEGGRRGQYTVSVVPVKVTGVTLNIEELEMNIGEKKVLQAVVLPENATNQNVAWSSSMTSVAVVSQSGQITAIRVGTTVITATTEDGEFTASCIVTVKPILVSSITLNASQTSLCIGDKISLTANVLPTNVTDKSVEWTSNNTSTAIVDENGNVTALAAGSATITATAADGSGVTGTCVITVNKKQTTTPELPEQSDTTDKEQTGTTTESTLPTVGTQLTISNGTFKVTKSTATNKEVTFTKPKNSKKATVTIPDTIKIDGQTYKVTEIAAKAFKNNKKLKSVTIGKNVKKIGKEAFSGCTKLKKITIKSTVLKSIGKNAIKGIDKKATIKCPKKQLSKYKKLFKGKTGYKKSMKIKK